MSSKLKKLGSLADIYQAEHLDGSITTVPLEKIRPSQDQPRRDRTLGVDELAASIKKDGLLSPIVVTRDGDGYRIIAGERRYHALCKLSKKHAECRIISREERDYWRISIIENLQRENLSAEEEAVALLKLKMQENYSDAELASLVGKSRNYITEILGIASLPEETLRECHEAGIDNKNLLIQVVQAQKKGSFSEFLDAYRSGHIRTVRAARDFNSRKKSESREGSAGGGETPAVKTSDVSAAEPSIKVSGSQLIINCPDSHAARKLAAWIRTNYPGSG